MTKRYAGIGSRNITKEVYQLFIELGKYLAENGFTLLSGGADGSDTAFEHGCQLGNGKKDIYIPWLKFNGRINATVVTNPKAFTIAEKYHPAFSRLSQGARKLMARNSHQVLGLDLESPIDFILCYTPPTGGTTQALRIAKDYNIPIFNLYEYETTELFIQAFNQFFINLHQQTM